MAAAVALLRGLISGSTAAGAGSLRGSPNNAQRLQQDEVYIYLRLLLPLMHEALADLARALAATISYRRPPVSDTQLPAAAFPLDVAAEKAALLQSLQHAFAACSSPLHPLALGCLNTIGRLALGPFFALPQKREVQTREGEDCACCRQRSAAAATVASLAAVPGASWSACRGSSYATHQQQHQRDVLQLEEVQLLRLEIHRSAASASDSNKNCSSSTKGVETLEREAAAAAGVADAAFHLIERTHVAAVSSLQADAAATKQPHQIKSERQPPDAVVVPSATQSSVVSIRRAALALLDVQLELQHRVYLQQQRLPARPMGCLKRLQLLLLMPHWTVISSRNVLHTIVALMLMNGSSGSVEQLVQKPPPPPRQLLRDAAAALLPPLVPQQQHTNSLSLNTVCEISVLQHILQQQSNSASTAAPEAAAAAGVTPLVAHGISAYSALTTTPPPTKQQQQQQLAATPMEEDEEYLHQQQQQQQQLQESHREYLEVHLRLGLLQHAPGFAAWRKSLESVLQQHAEFCKQQVLPLEQHQQLCRLQDGESFFAGLEVTAFFSIPLTELLLSAVFKACWSVATDDQRASLAEACALFLSRHMDADSHEALQLLQHSYLHAVSVSAEAAAAAAGGSASAAAPSPLTPSTTEPLNSVKQDESIDYDHDLAASGSTAAEGQQQGDATTVAAYKLQQQQYASLARKAAAYLAEVYGHLEESDYRVGVILTRTQCCPTATALSLMQHSHFGSAKNVVVSNLKALQAQGMRLDTEERREEVTWWCVS
ncbi:hypothetical protein cyc_07675 [Cyclospora cayetanensis]|uniref:Uncharacterized protein n=1 Tax=Cyclospora cayetanensis TaxID=88456 RepID=A0A1D3D5V4_9EIME|nr:hypothetical protein cyc_07675 [Cyclospora cayetanensis]